MDEIVKAAMAKWPRVPACCDWLALDARGDWYMRDAAAQAAGPFPAVKGSRIRHDKLLAFIARNYTVDGDGQWYFQNGPQRVYVELEAAPWVWRVDETAALVSHTGQAAQFRAGFVDEAGRLFVAADIGLGLVHSLDMVHAADLVADGRWPVTECRLDDLPVRFGYCLSPAKKKPPAGGLA